MMLTKIICRFSENLSTFGCEHGVLTRIKFSNPWNLLKFQNCFLYCF